MYPMFAFNIVVKLWKIVDKLKNYTRLYWIGIIVKFGLQYIQKYCVKKIVRKTLLSNKFIWK